MSSEYSELNGFEEEVQELLEGTRAEPSAEMWKALLGRIGTVEALGPLAHAGFTSELIWAILVYRPELEPWQRERIAGFVAITCLFNYFVAVPSPGIRVGELLFSRGIFYQCRDFDVERETYQHMTVRETHALLRAMGFSDREIMRSCRLALGGEYDEITSYAPGRRTPVRGLTYEDPYRWERESRQPLHQLIEAAGGPKWMYGTLYKPYIPS